MKELNLLLLHGWSIDALVKAPLGLIVAVLVKPDVLGGQALKSTHGAVRMEDQNLNKHYEVLN